MDLTNAPRAVDQLIEVCDDEHFRIARIEITSEDYEGVKVAAYDKDGKAFKYAMYWSGTGDIVADGY
jgi:hypothetical protein